MQRQKTGLLAQGLGLDQRSAIIHSAIVKRVRGVGWAATAQTSIAVPQQQKVNMVISEDVSRSAQGTLQGAAQGTLQGTAQGTLKGTLQGTAHGTLQGTAQGDARGTSQHVQIRTIAAATTESKQTAAKKKAGETNVYNSRRGV